MNLKIFILIDKFAKKINWSLFETGALVNLRESTSNEKVRNYHKEYYRPENLTIIITGQVKHLEVFKALQEIEEKILSKVIKQY